MAEYAIAFARSARKELEALDEKHIILMCESKRDVSVRQPGFYSPSTSLPQLCRLDKNICRKHYKIRWKPLTMCRL
jgi:hypothetical protein